MDAEMIRDQALAASGLLVARVGGPSVKPYQPPGLWEAVAMEESNTRSYAQDHGESLYRRTVYTFWKRAAPPPAMEIFNAPTREQPTLRRERTNTPLQALVLLDDPQFVEAARQLGLAAIRAAAETSSRLDFIAARALARPLTAQEQAALRRTVDDLTDRYGRNPQAAAALLAVGESLADAALPSSEQATWTMIASLFLNLDEALNK
jgi:hypothetical protein